MKEKGKLSHKCMMILSKCLPKNYFIALTMLELSNFLQFCQTKISDKQFKYFTAVLHHTVIVYLIIHHVHHYLEAKLINLLLKFFFKKQFITCIYVYFIILLYA